MEKINKLNILDKFLEMVKESWTYNKMTKDEQSICISLISGPRVATCLKYNTKHQWAVLQAIYAAYLDGLGYDGPAWRDTEDEN